MRSIFMRVGVTLVALASCGIAAAHPGHGAGALAGFAHPWLGFDHLLAMVAVGLWAFQLGGAAKWLVPASFVALMGLAGAAGMAGLALPMVEMGIAASVLLLGLLIAFSVSMTPVLGALVVGLFAVFHGYAHGVEMPAAGAASLYAAGFLLSTALLHGLGLALGMGLQRRALFVRASGAALALSGAWMMAAV